MSLAPSVPQYLVRGDPTANKPDNSAMIAELSHKFAALKIIASPTAQATGPKDVDQRGPAAAEPSGSNDGEVEKVANGPLPCHREACSIQPSPISPPDNEMDVDEEWESSSQPSVCHDDCAMDIDWFFWDDDEDVEMADCTECSGSCHCL